METTDVNLLPKEMMADKKVETFADKVRSLSYFLLSIIVLGTIGFAVFYFVLSSRISKTKAETQQLKTEIQALEQTEQQMVLFKDRLGKVSIAYALPSAYDEVVTLDNVYKGLPEGSFLSSSKLTSEKAEITIAVNGSSELANILSQIAGTRRYFKTELQQFTYDTERGYLVTVNIYTL